MSTSHAHTQAHANAAFPSDTDPTGTKTLRERRFIPELNRRFRRVRGLVRTTVGYENDAFGLRANAEPVEVFDFPTNPEKRRAFERWLNQALRDEVLEPTDLIGIRNGEHYTATYVRDSYSKALIDAGRRLREQGVDIEQQDVETMFKMPVHRSSLKRLYTRTYGNLEDITDDGAQSVREALTEGFADGHNPNKMATRINKEVEQLNISRARVLARTETINNYSIGTLDRYQRAGVGMVRVDAEWSTAGDRRVCPICETLEGRVMTIDEARNGNFEFEPAEGQPASLAGTYQIRPPAHPSCRCALLPVVQSANQVLASNQYAASDGVRSMAA